MVSPAGKPETVVVVKDVDEGIMAQCFALLGLCNVGGTTIGNTNAEDDIDIEDEGTRLVLVILPQLLPPPLTLLPLGLQLTGFTPWM